MRTEAGSPNGPSGRTITPCRSRRAANAAPSPTSTQRKLATPVERLEPALPQPGGEPVAARARRFAPPRHLLVFAEARERGIERRLRHVERVLDLDAGGGDVGRAEPVADPEAREPVDLRERSQNDAAAPVRELLAAPSGYSGSSMYSK